MIVRSLGEVALELWPREKMVEMVNQKRERVRVVFGAQFGDRGKSRYWGQVGNKFWEMDMTFKERRMI
jgi:hypothetical protein